MPIPSIILPGDSFDPDKLRASDGLELQEDPFSGVTHGGPSRNQIRFYRSFAIADNPAGFLYPGLEGEIKLRAGKDSPVSGGQVPLALYLRAFNINPASLADVTHDAEVRVGAFKQDGTGFDLLLISSKGQSDFVRSPPGQTVSDRPIWGRVTAAGAITSGNGFSVAHPGAGQYTITPDTAFLSAPIVTGAIGENATRVFLTHTTLTTSFKVTTATTAGAPIDCGFTFAAFPAT